MKELRKAQSRLEKTPGLAKKIAVILRWIRRFLGSALYVHLLRENKRIDAFYDRLLRDKSFAQEFAKDNMPFNVDLRVVLDAGCGKGRATAALSLLGGRAVGIDIAKHDFWRRIQGASFALADLASMPFRESSYDACVCLTVLMYVRDDKQVLREIYRILKPSGVLVLQVANRRNLRTVLTGRKLDPTHIRVYEKRELEDLVRKMGFEVQFSTSIGFYSPILTHFIGDLLTQETWHILGGLLPEEYRGVLLCVCEKKA